MFVCENNNEIKKNTTKNVKTVRSLLDVSKANNENLNEENSDETIPMYSTDSFSTDPAGKKKNQVGSVKQLKNNVKIIDERFEHNTSSKEFFFRIRFSFLVELIL